MEVQVSDWPDSCWISSLATVTGIDVELFPPPYQALVPGVDATIESWAGPPHVDRCIYSNIANLRPWADLMLDNGYETRLTTKRPVGTPSIILLSIPQTARHWEAHATPVDAEGYIRDVLRDSPIDGLHVDDLQEWCNVIPVGYVWFEPVTKP